MPDDNRLATSRYLQDNYADYYAETQSEWRDIGARQKAANIAALCAGIAVGSCLEIGAGEGAVLQRLDAMGFARELYALEISPSGVAAMEQRAIPSLREARLFDGYAVPYEDGRFDLAVLSHVIEHVEFPRKLLYEARRVARYVYVEVPLEDTLRLPRNFAFSKVGHINFYSPRSIRYLVQSSGLRVLRERTRNSSRAAYRYLYGARGAPYHALTQAALQLAPAVATRLFTYHQTILAERAADT